MLELSQGIVVTILLLVQKALGKTTFLQALVIATQKVGKRTIAAYVDVSKHYHKKGPYELIFDILETMLIGFSDEDWKGLKEKTDGKIVSLLNFYHPIKGNTG